MKRIYMDHAATTPVRKEVVDAVRPFFSGRFGNPSSLHSFGRDAKAAMEESREKIANALGARPSEMIFTSGGTEADNLALIGTAFANKSKGKHIITTRIEHHAVLDACRWLEQNGFEVTYLPVDRHGLVSPAAVEGAIKKGTILVSVMHANNEIGTIEPVNEIGKACRDNDVYFHTDAVQSFCKIPLDASCADMISISGHKIYGPKGIGALYVRSDTKVSPIIHGGGQESGFRSGTENIPGIAGFAKAAELAAKEMKSEAKRLSLLRDRLIKNILKVGDSWLNGHPSRRLPNNAHFCFRYIEGEALILSMDAEGIAASTGSACSSKSLEPSHVLLALGMKHEEAHGSLRLTLGISNTKHEVDYAAERIPAIIGRLREISPFKKRW